MLKRMLSLFLAVVLCLSVTAVAYGDTVIPEGYPAVRLDPATGQPYDFGGATITIYDYWSGDSSTDIRVEDPTDEQAAMYAYRDWLMQTYNCHIVQKMGGDWGTQASEFNSFVLDPDGSYRLYIVEPGAVSTLIRNGTAAAWESSGDTGVDLTDGTWNSASSELYTIGGKTYGTSKGKSEPRGMLFFNKRILTEAGIDWNSLYDMQKAGTWTWSTLESVLQAVKTAGYFGLIGSSDDFYKLAVFSNGGSFAETDEDGNLAITANSDETVEALDWAKSVWSTYVMPQPEDASWDWYTQAWMSGQCAFYSHQAYAGFNYGFSDLEDDWGAVAFPIGPGGTTYITVVSDNATLIPNVYDEQTAAKLAMIYDLWTMPTPGYAGSEWIGNKYDLTDERAVDETYAMLREDGHAICDKLLLLGTQNDTEGPVFWNLSESDTEALIDTNMPIWQELCDSFNADVNGPVVPQLEAPVISNMVHGGVIGKDFSATVSLPEGAEIVYTEVGFMDGDQFNCLDWFVNDTSIKVLGFEFDTPGTYRIRSQAWTHDFELEPSKALGDSEMAYYDFVLAETEMPACPAVTLSGTEFAYDKLEDVTYTIPGAEAVTFHWMAMDLVSDEIIAGMNMPTSFEAGSTDTIPKSFLEQPANHKLTFWARINGIWSRASDVYTITVQPLGYLQIGVTCGGLDVEDTVTLRDAKDAVFTVYSENATTLSCEISRLNPGGNGRKWLNWLDNDGEEAVFDVSEYLTDNAVYELRFLANRDGWVAPWYIVQVTVDPSAFCGPETSWTLDESGVLTVTGSGEVTGKPWADRADSIRKVVIGDGVTSLCDDAFLGCGALTEVALPESLISIGEFTFYGCTQLTEITIPSGLKTLGAGAFMGSGLSSVLVPEGTQTRTWYFYEPDPNWTYQRVYSVALPETVETVESPFLGAPFADFAPDFVTPAELTTIEAEAFFGTDVRFVWLTDQVTNIGDGAFAECKNPLLVRIPAGCTVIDPDAFPEDVLLFVEYNSEGLSFAEENNLPHVIYAEGFNG